MQNWRGSSLEDLVPEGEKVCAMLERALGQVYVNLDTDPELGDERHGAADRPEALRSKLLAALCAVKDLHEGNVETALASFCHRREHQQRGPSSGADRSTIFGRVTRRRSFEEHLADDEMSAIVADSSPTNLVEDLLGQPYEDQRVLLRSIKLSLYQMFAFYQEARPDDPFDGLDLRREKLRSRLGLGHYLDDHEMLLWAHELDARQREPRMPTALDACENPYWGSGGRTVPLDGRGKGLPEVVHDPIVGDQLRRAIEAV